MLLELKTLGLWSTWAYAIAGGGKLILTVPFPQQRGAGGRGMETLVLRELQSFTAESLQIAASSHMDRISALVGAACGRLNDREHFPGGSRLSSSRTSTIWNSPGPKTGLKICLNQIHRWTCGTSWRRRTGGGRAIRRRAEAPFRSSMRSLKLTRTWELSPAMLAVGRTGTTWPARPPAAAKEHAGRRRRWEQDLERPSGRRGRRSSRIAPSV